MTAFGTFAGNGIFGQAKTNCGTFAGNPATTFTAGITTETAMTAGSGAEPCFSVASRVIFFDAALGDLGEKSFRQNRGLASALGDKTRGTPGVATISPAPRRLVAVARIRRI
jgi:hypothetical protein